MRLELIDAFHEKVFCGTRTDETREKRARLVYLVRAVISAGNHSVRFEISPSSGRITAVATVSAPPATERQLLGRKQLIEFPVGVYAQTIGKRSGSAERLNKSLVIG